MVWAVAVAAQVERLHADRRAFVASSAEVRRKGFYGPDDARAPRQMRADAHLLLIAANQLAKALQHFDGDLRLTAGVTRKHVRALRDWHEHWEGRGRRAKQAVAKFTDDPAAHQWRPDGSGLLGGIVDDEALRTWARHVYDSLVNYDPPSPRAKQ
jgi:hypothetical protein